MTAQPDYSIRSASAAPLDYPAVRVPDSFSEAPFLPSDESRRQAFFEHILRNPAPENTKAVWHELARLAAGGTPHQGIFHAALDFIDARQDCADFALHGILRLLHQFTAENAEHAVNTLENSIRPAAEAAVPDLLVTRARQTILNFKYFPDEPGLDSLCTWTENHYILYTSAAYLAGQLYPDDVFTNSGETGQQKVKRHRPRILRWLDLRFHTGFSEWLSHVYYDEDLAALLSLYDFAADDEIRRKAEMIIDLLLLDMALNSFKGVFGSTHGRAYEHTKKHASHEGTTDTFKLLFGMGVFSEFDNMSATAFALSRYRVPRVIEVIANAGQLENRQRLGIQVAEMEQWGLRPDNFEDGMLLLTLEAYLHPRTIANTIRMFDTCHWWENDFLAAFKPYRGWLKALNAIGALPLLARYLERDACRNTREEVNVYTYRTPDYMLSTAQDYRKGYGGDQQHVWQATLGPEAVCFTTHPAKMEGAAPNYWAGNGLLPRAAQYKNVAIVIYNIEKIPALYVPIKLFFTHAWLPRDKFDEVAEHNGWIVARKGAGYLALRSQNPYVWSDNDSPQSVQRVKMDTQLSPRLKAEDVGREILAAGAQNIWLCQLGRRADDGEFNEFAEQISSAHIAFDGMNVEYQSPGNGLIRFGWNGPLSVDTAEVALKAYRRYENAYMKTEFGADEINIAAGEYALTLNWTTGERENR